MKSIRGTLLLYFLALEALVLGAVSFYVYSVTGAALQAKDGRTLKLLEDRYQTRRNDIREKFDEETLLRTQQLARLVISQRGQPLQRLQPLGALTELTHPAGHVATIAWLGQAVDGWLAWRLLMTNTIHLAEQFLPPAGDGHEQEYFQIWSESNRSLQRSGLLNERDLNLVLDLDAREIAPFMHKFRDVTLEPGREVRQVIYKVPLYQVQNVQYGPFGLPLPSATRRPMTGRGNGPRTGPPTPPTTPRSTPRPLGVFANPCILLVFARDSAQCDARIAASHQHLLEDQDRVRQETQAALAYLRDKLMILCLVTFGLTVAGGTLLVHHGLRPLGRVADAVSQVSERDFHLRIADAEVPMEMVPVVRRLKEALQSLEKAFTHEKQAVADISHELRTPIASLTAAIQVCLRKPRAAEEYRKALQNCLEIAAHLNQLVEQLLTLARLDAGAVPLQTELVNVTELAEQCADMIRPLAEQQELTLRFHPTEAVETETDAGKLKEIVTNLLSNAMQYNKPRGEITLAVRTARARVCVEVTDTGIGIEDEARRHLFERFYRADPSRHSDTVHAGLGLSIVKGYLDLLGGGIEVDSQPGRGSTFRVWLPLRVPAEALAVS